MFDKNINTYLYLLESVYEALVVYERSTEDWQRCYYRWDLEWAIEYYEDNKSIGKEYADSFIM